MSSLLGLDVGAKRIGVALARADVRIAQPLTTLEVESNTSVIAQIIELVTEHDAACIVTGWPRGLVGQATEQTKTVEAFVAELRQALSTSNVAMVPVVLQDEALTSQKAEAELATRRKPYVKADIDALAATYILEDYLHEHTSSTAEASHV